jgi:four helix bundle protein
MVLFDLVLSDMRSVQRDPTTYKLVSQQIGSADSIASNIEEGHGRLSRTEYVRFLDYARASARETRGRYVRMRSWFETDLVEERLALCDDIIGILTRTLVTLRTNLYPRGGTEVHEPSEEYSVAGAGIPSTPDPRPSSHV